MSNQIESEKEILKSIITNFVVSRKQERFLEFIQTPRRKDDLLRELFVDTRNIVKECLLSLPRENATPESVFRQLRQLGASNKAYILSNDWKVDGKSMSLEDALESTVNKQIGSIVFDLVGTRLGYFEDGEQSQYIIRALDSSQAV